MSTLNKVILIGNLGQDPDSRVTQNGHPVCNMSIATKERFKQGDEWQEKTEWHRIVVWGKQAEFCAQYLTKGRKVCVEGSLQTRQYEKDGQRHYMTEIKAQSVQFLDRAQQQGQAQDSTPYQADGSNGQYSHQYGDPQRPAGGRTPAPPDDSDVPF